MSIFRDHAPLYWAAGIPAMPLKQWNSPGKGAGKAPILSQWTQYGTHMPTEAMRATWLNAYPESNIGFPFGPASGLCAIDIDAEDQALVDAIVGALPKSPWVRIGKKGMGLIYRWQGQPNFKLRDSENQSIVEFLGLGNQMVLPPSVHPDTGKPYTSDTNLWEVMDKILPLPLDIERILRGALEPVIGTKGLTLSQAGRSSPLEVVPAGERDIQMVRHAGYLSRVVLGIDKNKKYSLSEAMEHMYTWVSDYTARIAGDDMDPQKGVEKLLEFLLRDVEKGKTLPDGWETGLTEAQLKHPAIAEMIKKNHIQRWTPSKAKDWFLAKIVEEPGDPDYAFRCIAELTELLARDENFKEAEFKLLFDTFKTNMPDFKLSKPDLTGMFREARRGDGEQAPDHEAIARQVVEEMSKGGEVVYDKSQFWQWNGSCFKAIDEDQITRAIAADVKGNILSRRYNDYQAITKTVALVCRGELAKELEPGVNFANGFLTTDLQLHEHSPKYGKTFTMPFDYIPARAGEAHRWLEFLENSWGDDDDYSAKVMALQEAFAATMFGLAPKHQAAFLLYGEAGTGKTQVLEVLRALMPADSQSSVPPELWGERFQQAPMVGKALNICGELPEAAIITGNVFKEVVEGGAQQTEFKGKAIFEYRPTAAQWFASNFLPRSKDTSKGFTRRWQIWEFTRVVPQHERILNFHEVLISEEREAIAAWAVEGLKRLQKQRGYTQPASHIECINLIQRGNNSVAAFLQSTDRIKEDPNAAADVRAIYDHYVVYMKDISKGWSVSFERFMPMLKQLGYKIEDYIDGVGINRRQARGLRLKNAVLPEKLAN